MTVTPIALTESPADQKGLKTDLRDFTARRGFDGPYADNLDVDVLIIGGGFGGTYMLYQMLKEGYNTVLYDAGSELGGVWHFNAYPGARTDTEVPIYEFSIPEVYNTWNWSTNYPEWSEIQRYFRHVDQTLNLSKHAAFQTVVTGSVYDTNAAKWNVTTADGRRAKATFLIVAAGFSSKRYIPNFKGLDKFQGTIHHSSFWPAEGVETAGKRVAVIGSGASGVQIVQELGQEAKSLCLFHRTPNLALPMRRKMLSPEKQNQAKDKYDHLYDLRERCFGGFAYEWDERNTLSNTPEEREKFWESLWEQGGFRFWLGNYKDYLFDIKANREVYNFWRKKQSSRVTNPIKRAVLFPEEPPHPFGVKRPCLEQNFYEIIDLDHVELVDVTEDGTIVEFTEKGLRTKDREYEFDVIALATGFDANTGGLTNMGLESIHGTKLKDEWKDGVHTYLGTTISGYPNMFQIYGPQGPTLLCNGPTAVEVQVRWVRDVIKQIGQQGIKYIDAQVAAQKSWKAHINELSDRTLFPTVASTYMGGNIPGKVKEQLNYTGGIADYKREIRSALDSWEGFNIVKP
ncbi:uncharacterized protein N7500_007831 [Penicillium coprophilum]|uniref:uncharacterized protein n=1 Tax=Penicillium coprophilum TaxID=36646 RepID=UPI0023986B6B|nr:uncharacterized protein N7500_007831 [Penicillium coprophilum]KAJ5158180.1 hypothetical protein N7500_007831 [Penicillium coprophilum]